MMRRLGRIYLDGDDVGCNPSLPQRYSTYRVPPSRMDESLKSPLLTATQVSIAG